MSKLSRDKGKRFERKVAHLFRKALPHYADSIRRSDQSHRASLSDVTGVPGYWVECQDAAKGNHNPVKKLEQAINDVSDGTTPIAVTHEKGAKRISVTMRAADFLELWLRAPQHLRHVPVTLDWDDFAAALKETTP